MSFSIRSPLMKFAPTMPTQDQKQLVFQKLRERLSQLSPPLAVQADMEGKYELAGMKTVTVHNKTQEGIFFASAVIMKGHVGFYFFPIYTHPERFQDMPESLKKALKGKSCFHIKKDDDVLFTQVDEILKKGLVLYKEISWA